MPTHQLQLHNDSSCVTGIMALPLEANSNFHNLVIHPEHKVGDWEAPDCLVVVARSLAYACGSEAVSSRTLWEEMECFGHLSLTHHQGCFQGILILGWWWEGGVQIGSWVFRLQGSNGGNACFCDRVLSTGQTNCTPEIPLFQLY